MAGFIIWSDMEPPTIHISMRKRCHQPFGRIIFMQEASITRQVSNLYHFCLACWKWFRQ